MKWINYHHLYYFWRVATVGTISEVCKELRLSQPTISSQLKTFEDSIGEKLFSREGRNLELTETGRIVLKYADEIFSLGNELLNVVEGKLVVKPSVLKVGVADVVPKLIVFTLLNPILQMQDKVKLTCVEGKTEKLLGDLSIQELDAVIADCPIPPTVKIKAYNHFLGECGVSFLASERITKKIKNKFPVCLDGIPILLPISSYAMRRELDYWFNSLKIYPHVVAEFQDSGLMKIFGREGAGVIVVPTIIEKEVIANYKVQLVGRTDQIKERLYLISTERKARHPALTKLCEEAKKNLNYD